MNSELGSVEKSEKRFRKEGFYGKYAVCQKICGKIGFDVKG